MSKATKPELTREQKVAKILQARTGWGRLQAEAFCNELLEPERDAIVACGLEPEHAVAAQRLFNEISDLVRARRPKPEPPVAE